MKADFMSGMYGADIAQLRLLATKFTNAADRLESARSTVGQAVHGSHWVGPNADAYRRRWDSADSPRVHATALQLRRGAKQLLANAAAQEQVSAADGGSSGAGSGAGHPRKSSDNGFGFGDAIAGTAPWFLKAVGIWPEHLDSDMSKALWGAGLATLVGGVVTDALLQHKSVFQPRIQGRFVSVKGMSFIDRLEHAAKSESWHAKSGQAASVAKWEAASKWLNRAGTVVAGGTAAWSQWQDDAGYGTGERTARAAVVGVSAGGGAWAGASAGAWAGGALGTVLIPIPGVGTAVGGVVGGAIGGWAGSEAGQFVGHQINSHAGAAVRSAGDAIETVGRAAGDVASGVGHAVGGAAEGVGHAAEGVGHAVGGAAEGVGHVWGKIWGR